MTDDAVVDVVPKYPSNVLSSFEAGCVLDFRVKLAIDLLRSPYFHGAAYVNDADTRVSAVQALELADALLDEAAKRGLVSPLPAHGELTAALKHHIERGIAAQVFQAQETQRAQRGMGPMLQGMSMPVMNQ